MTQSRSVVGFIGLGAIGYPMAERLVQGGEDVIVYNRTLAKAARFRGRAKIAASPAEMGDQADVIFACVTTAHSYRDVVLGPFGIMSGSRVKTYVHLGTNEVALLEELAASLEVRGIATLDAPMTGGTDGAANGTLTVMAAGPREAFDRVKPLIEHYASTIVFLSERVGMAQVMKLVNNVISAGNLAVACEAMLLGRKSGLDPAVMLEIINNGSGQSNATLTRIPAQILTRKFGQGAGLCLATTILEMAGAEARLRDVPMPLAEAIIASFQKAATHEGDTADVTRIIRPMERAAGVTLGSAANNESCNAGTPAMAETKLLSLSRVAQER
jgi:3-hydroxyisobutyrate dehydrogenase-like beta-hydroxyacid dehydrogenase